MRRDISAVGVFSLRGVRPDPRLGSPAGSPTAKNSSPYNSQPGKAVGFLSARERGRLSEIKPLA